MKKFLLFVSIVFLSLLIVNNKVYAQELPVITMRIPYIDSFTFTQSNENTYEFYAYYGIEEIIIEDLAENEYYMIFDMFEPYKKGLDRRTNSYELVEVEPFDPFHTTFTIHMTILKSIIDAYGSVSVEANIDQFLNEVPILYIKYYPGPDSIVYQAGYNDGYNNGFNDGFQVGDENGYNRGFNDGYDDGFDYGRDLGKREGYYDGYEDGYEQGVIIGKQFSYEDGFIDGQEFGYNLGYDDALKLATTKFQSNIHQWIIPAIIIVIIAGIFVGYRREQYHD